MPTGTFPVPTEIPPQLGFNTRVFDIGRYQQVTPGGAGFIQTIERASPAWFAQFQTPPLSPTRYSIVRAFLDELEGSLGSALWYDPRRPMPLAYAGQPLTADPWAYPGQIPWVYAIDYAASTLSLGRMAQNCIVSLGDYISFQIGTVWYCFRVTQGGTVDGSNSITVKVKPRPLLITGFDQLPVNIRYRKAPFEGKIIGGIDEQDQVDSNPVISFKVFQFLNRTLP